jgi:two-component system, NtrC family, sensor kinase
MDEQIRILFVDDEKNVLRSLQRTFLDDEYEILTASSGAEGLSLLEQVSPIHLVISDYRMPEMTGVDFLCEVVKKWPDTVRIVLSGYADTASIVSAINDGHIYKFIPKPWNDDELRVTIANALEKYFISKKNLELANELTTKNEELARINHELNRLIAERTSQIKLQNEVVSIAHNINYSIPLGVIGLDPDGIIVQCNKEAEKKLSADRSDMLGNRYDEKLPQDVCEFIEGIADREPISRRFIINGIETKVIVGFMDMGVQKGTILVFDGEI